ncbi:aspartate ammonia-lyase, partial [Xanthomonas citri pv. citri]|nr:aspartate ammonia-lyase [Xanthomonas citri pv. citri]
HRNQIHKTLNHNPILITTLNPIINYKKTTKITKHTYKKQHPMLNITLKNNKLSKTKLHKLLNPTTLTTNNIHTNNNNNNN